MGFQSSERRSLVALTIWAFFLFFCAGRRFNQAHWEHFVCWSHSILAAFLTPTSPAGYLSLKRAMGSATLD